MPESRARKKGMNAVGLQSFSIITYLVAFVADEESTLPEPLLLLSVQAIGSIKAAAKIRNTEYRIMKKFLRLIP